MTMDWFSRLKKFFSEVRAEMTKVSFPSRQEVIATTVVVLVTSFVFAAFLWVSDLAILQGYEALRRALG